MGPLYRGNTVLLFLQGFQKKKRARKTVEMFLSLERKAVLRENKGSFKKRVFQKALREMGFYALCSGSKKLITHSASNFGVIFF